MPATKLSMTVTDLPLFKDLYDAALDVYLMAAKNGAVQSYDRELARLAAAIDAIQQAADVRPR